MKIRLDEYENLRIIQFLFYERELFFSRRSSRAGKVPLPGTTSTAAASSGGGTGGMSSSSGTGQDASGSGAAAAPGAASANGVPVPASTATTGEYISFYSVIVFL